MYGGLILSGIFAAIDPSRLVTEQISALMALLWAVAMSVSAAICFYGSLTDQWIGEFTGIPLLASVLALYGGSAVLSSEDEGLVLLAYGLVVLSFAAGLIARWRDVREIKNNATDMGTGKGA